MASLRLACIPPSGQLETRLRVASTNPRAVRAFSNVDDLAPAIQNGEIDCTVIAVESADYADALRSIRRLRDLFPQHAVVAWCRRRALTPIQLAEVANSGVADLALAEVDDLQHVFSRMLSAATQRSHAFAIESRLAGVIPRKLRPLFRYALENGDVSLEVDDVAATFGITRRTLCTRMAQHGLPQPRVFLTWCRLLVAGSLLDERGRTLDSVAGQLDFPSGHVLGNRLRQYTGLGIASLREGDVRDLVEAAFRRAVDDSAAATAAHRESKSSLPLPSTKD